MSVFGVVLGTGGGLALVPWPALPTVVTVSRMQQLARRILRPQPWRATVLIALGWPIGLVGTVGVVGHATHAHR